MFFNNKCNTFFGLNLTLVYTFPMCMTWCFHFPLRNYDFKGGCRCHVCEMTDDNDPERVPPWASRGHCGWQCGITEYIYGWAFNTTHEWAYNCISNACFSLASTSSYHDMLISNHANGIQREFRGGNSYTFLCHVESQVEQKPEASFDRRNWLYDHPVFLNILITTGATLRTLCESIKNIFLK